MVLGIFLSNFLTFSFISVNLVVKIRKSIQFQYLNKTNSQQYDVNIAQSPILDVLRVF